MKIDLHNHTKYSRDSMTDPEKLIRKAEKLGIIPAITDHNTINAHEVLKKINARFIPGEEIKTEEGDLIALYINENIPKKTPFIEAIERIKEQGGISYLPHMYDISRHGVNDPELAEKVDIIEVFNARCPFQSYNERAKEFATQHGKLSGAGSDEHFLLEFSNAHVDLPDFDITNPKELIKALRSRSVTIVGKKAPLYVRGTTTMVKFFKNLFR